MPSRNPLELIAWLRRARAGERRAVPCIPAAILAGILGLATVANGPPTVPAVALAIVALIFPGGWFHMHDAPPR